MNEEIVMMVSGLSSGHMSRSIVEAGLAGKILRLQDGISDCVVVCVCYMCIYLVISLIEICRSSN